MRRIIVLYSRSLYEKNKSCKYKNSGRNKYTTNNRDSRNNSKNNNSNFLQTYAAFCRPRCSQQMPNGNLADRYSAGMVRIYQLLHHTVDM